MEIYDEFSQNPIVPDRFLSLGVERFIGENGRSSFVLWEKDGITPVLAFDNLAIAK